jgi:PTS system cellobiose-specific IIB component
MWEGRLTIIKPIKVLLVCAAGMSSSLLWKSMCEAAEATGVELEVQSIFATGAALWDFERNYFDVVLIAPQVRFMRRNIEKVTEPLGIIVLVIDPQTYGMVDGNKLFRQVWEALGARDEETTSLKTDEKT